MLKQNAFDTVDTLDARDIHSIKKFLESFQNAENPSA